MASNVVNGAHNDGQNQVMSVIGVIGTLGTADTQGTALTLPIAVDPSTGAMYVNNLGASGTGGGGGTVVDIHGGTLNAGTVSVNTPGTITSGTISVNTPGTITSGTVAINAGTVGGKAASGAASVANPVQIAGTDGGGTVYSPFITTGGIVKVVDTAGTISSGSMAITAGSFVGTVAVSTPGTITSGTVSVNTPGTITSGSIAVTAGTGIITVGTVGGKAASGAASVANPVQIAGTDSGGSVYSPLITTAGAGTVSGVGTIPGVGIVTTVTNITNGTIQNSGTVTGVGVLSAMTTGTIGAGTIGGKAASGAASVANPVQIAGTDNGGTVYSPFVTTGGILKVTDTAGTIISGSIAVTAGTMIQTIGTVNSGTMNTGTLNAGTINTGTIKNDGRPARNILSFGSTFTFAGSNFATIVGSAAIGAGTSLWVQDISIVSTGAVTAGVMFGSNINGSAVLAKGNFGTNGGIEKSFTMAVNAGMTNTDLNCWVNGAGTIDVTVSYFIST